MHKMRPSFTTMGFLFMTRQASIKGAECTAHSVRPFFRWARLGLPVASACLLAACGGGDSVEGAYLCALGDASPSILPTPDSVESAANLSIAGKSCYTKL